MTSEWFERKNGEGGNCWNKGTKYKRGKNNQNITANTEQKRGVDGITCGRGILQSTRAHAKQSTHGWALSLVTPVSLSGDRTTPAPAATNTWRWWWWWCWWSLCWRCGRLLQHQWFSQRTTDGWVSAIRDCACVAGSERQGGFGGQGECAQKVQHSDC